MQDTDYQEIERQNSQNPTGFSKYSTDYIQRRIKHEKIIKDLNHRSGWAKISLKIAFYILISILLISLLYNPTLDSFQIIFLLIFSINTYLLINIKYSLKNIQQDIDVLKLYGDSADVTNTVFATYIEEQISDVHKKLDQIQNS